MLPSSTLAGLEFGNEPDLYWRENWLSKERVPTTTPSISKTWNLNYSAADYRRDWLSYAAALRAKLPGFRSAVPRSSPPSPSGWCDRGPGPTGPELPQHPPLCLVDVLAVDLALLPLDRHDAGSALELWAGQLDPECGRLCPQPRSGPAADRGQLDQLRGQCRCRRLVLHRPVGARRAVRADRGRRRLGQLAPAARHPQRPVPAHVEGDQGPARALRAGRVRPDDPARARTSSARCSAPTAART